MYKLGSTLYIQSAKNKCSFREEFNQIYEKKEYHCNMRN